MNLFCLPFAGGGKHSYRELAEKAPGFINMVPIDLPGRGARVIEPLLTSLHSMTEDVWQQIKNDLHKPYAFYGHSMGTLLVYLLTHKAIEEGYPQPAHLFLTGCRAPSARDSEGIVHNLPREAFLQKVRTMGGMADEVLNNEVLMSFFEPILRADFEAVETFRYVERKPFHINITAITGTEENITPAQVKAWEKETTAGLDIHTMPGRHFFIFEYEKEIMKMIGDRLRNYTTVY